MLLNVVLEKTVDSPLDCKEIQPVNPKGNQSWIFIGRTSCWSLNSNTLATWCEELTHWERPWCWERLKAGGEGDDKGWDGWMASPTRWTWVWVSSGIWWYTGNPGMLQSTGSQKSRKRLSDWTDWTERLEMIWTKYLVHYQVYIKVTKKKIDIILNNS